MVLMVSCGTTLSSGTCCVVHNKGPIAHNSESSNTDIEPETAIWPKMMANGYNFGKACVKGLVFTILLCEPFANDGEGLA